MKKKVIIITSEFPPQPGGMGNQALNIALGLHKADFEICVVTNNRSTKEKIIEKGFDEALPFQVLRATRCRLSIFTYFQRIKICFGQIKSVQSNIIISSGKFSIWLTCFFKFIFPNRVYLAILHGSELGFNGLTRLITKLSLSQFNHAIAVSNYTKSLGQKLQPNLYTTVIPNGFDPFRFKLNFTPKNLPGFPSIITIGNVTYRKGQHNVIKALPEILKKFPDAHYHLVGIPTEQKVFASLAENKGVATKITFHGPLTDKDLTLALAGSDIFMMLSERQKNGDVEGFGIAILEANYFGIPAIGSKDSGIADAINHGISGILVDPANPDEIVEALQTIMNNYDGFSRQAKDWSLQFTWDKIIHRYLKVLEEVNQQD